MGPPWESTRRGEVQIVPLARSKSDRDRAAIRSRPGPLQPQLLERRTADHDRSPRSVVGNEPDRLVEATGAYVVLQDPEGDARVRRRRREMLSHLLPQRLPHPATPCGRIDV